MKMKKRLKCLVLVVIILGLGFSLIYLDDLDLKNDYYEVVNEEVISKVALSSDEYTWSVFSKAQEKSDEKLDEIILRLINDGSMGIIADSTIEEMRTIYENANDMESRNERGISDIKKYLEKIVNSKNISELIENGMEIENALCVDIFTNIVVGSDYVDNSENIVYLYPVTYVFGTSADYYSDDDYMTYKAYIKRAMIRLFAAYGYSDEVAKEKARGVISFYEKIGSESKLSADFSSVTSYYNVISSSEFTDVYSRLQSNYLSDRGIGNEANYSLVDEGQYSALNESLTEDNLGVWKDVILIKVLGYFASYMGDDYVSIVNDLSNSLMGIEEDEEDDEDEVLDLIYDIFSSEIDLVYASEVMGIDEKEEISALVTEIKSYYKIILEENEWLSEDTIVKAIEKLEAMNVYIGEDGADESESKEYDIISFKEGGSLVSNIISVLQTNYQEMLERLDNNSKGKILVQSEVNAYYNPLDNSIYIPASLTFLESGDSYYEMLGSIGMIIAHEITHGFDGNGSLFDAKGNLSNWWTDEDRKNFESLSEEVSNYYSQYEVINGKYIDGDATVNENIADMGAVKCITGVALANGASDSELKTMYEAFAKMWASVSSEEYMELLLLEDSHAPNKYRVNAVLSLIDEFYDVYDVYFWNDMYIDPKNRVSVW